MRSLLGSTEDEAKATISSLGLSAGASSYVYNDTYAEGTVVWQSAEAGTRVETGTKVYLQISKGPRNPVTPEPEIPTDNEGEIVW